MEDQESIVWKTENGGTYQEYTVNFFTSDDPTTILIDKNVFENTELRWKVFETADGHISGEENKEMDSAIFKKNVTVETSAFEHWHPCRPTRSVDQPRFIHMSLQEAIEQGRNKFVGIVRVDDDGSEMELVSEIIKTADLVDLLKNDQAC